MRQVLPAIAWGLPRRCVAPWRAEEDPTRSMEICPDGCRPAARIPGVAPRRRAATNRGREPAPREKGALRRCAIGGWTEEDRRAVEELCDECESNGCPVDADILAERRGRMRGQLLGMDPRDIDDLMPRPKAPKCGKAGALPGWDREPKVA